MPELGEWENFYVIVGSSAGALIGLQFIVMTLIAERPPPRAAEAGRVFATPTIVHFSAVLLLSALLSMPLHTTIIAAVLVCLVGLSGLIYGAIVAGRMRNQVTYKPDAEDWGFFVLLPLVAYAMLTASAFEMPFHTREALFGVGASTLLLLFTGIHNTWDSVSYLVLFNAQRPGAELQQDKPSENDSR
jgi:hypothetical protein